MSNKEQRLKCDRIAFKRKLIKIWIAFKCKFIVIFHFCQCSVKAMVLAPMILNNVGALAKGEKL